MPRILFTILLIITGVSAGVSSDAPAQDVRLGKAMDLWLENDDMQALSLHTVFSPPHDFAKMQALTEHAEAETAMRVALTFINHGGVQAEFAVLPQGFGRDGAYTAYLPMIHHGVIPSFRLKGDLTNPAIWPPDALLMYQTFKYRTNESIPTPLPAWLAILNGILSEVDIADGGLVGRMINRLSETHRNLLATRSSCDAHRPDEGNQCFSTAAVMQRTGFNGLWAFSSPTNTIIEPARYYQNASRGLPNSVVHWIRSLVV